MVVNPRAVTGAAGGVELQVAPAEASITQALDQVRAAGGGGVVAVSEDGYRVLSVDDMLQGLRSLGDVALSDVATDVVRIPRGDPEPADPVRVTMVKARAPLIGTPDAKATSSAMISGLAPAEAATLRASLTLFRCTLDPTHVWLADELAQPGRCNLDGAPVTAS